MDNRNEQTALNTLFFPLFQNYGKPQGELLRKNPVWPETLPFSPSMQQCLLSLHSHPSKEQRQG